MRCLRIPVAIVAFSLSAPALSFPGADKSVEISLQGKQAEVTQGDLLDFSLQFRNPHDRPFYIERPRGFGQDSLLVVARRGECEYEISPMYPDRPLATLRFMYFPLLPDDELRITLPSLNEPGSQLHIPLPHPGKYKFTAQFTSQGSEHEGLIWPIWRGRALSNVVEVTVKPMNQGQRQELIRQLQNCLRDAECDVLATAQSFEVSYVPGSVSLLRQLLRKDPEANAIVASALMTQGDETDAEFLTELARTIPDSRAVDFFMEVANRIVARKDVACWWAR